MLASWPCQVWTEVIFSCLSLLFFGLDQNLVGGSDCWRHSSNMERYMEEAVTLTFCCNNMVSDILLLEVGQRFLIVKSLILYAVPRRNTLTNERNAEHRQNYSREQGRREKFRAPGQKFRLGILVSGARNHVMSKEKGHSVRRCSNFGPKSHSLRKYSNFGSSSSDEQNKVIASADVRISARNKKKHHRVRRP